MIYLPAYEYKCPNGHTTIITEPIANEHKAPKKCRQCKENLVRLFGSPSIQFKGTGWGKDQKREIDETFGLADVASFGFDCIDYLVGCQFFQ